MPSSPQRTALSANGVSRFHQKKKTLRLARFKHLLRIHTLFYSLLLFYYYYFFLYEFTGSGCPGYKVF